MTMDCPKCGEQVYIVKGLHHDRDDMRDNRWCEECKIMFSCHAHGLEERLVLKDVYESEAKGRIERLLRAALAEVAHG